MGNTLVIHCSMQFGHLEEAGGVISKIDWTDLKLSDFEKEDTVPMNYKIAFTGFYSDISLSHVLHHTRPMLLRHNATLTFARHCFSFSSGWETV